MWGEEHLSFSISLEINENSYQLSQGSFIGNPFYGIFLIKWRIESSKRGTREYDRP